MLRGYKPGHNASVMKVVGGQFNVYLRFDLFTHDGSTLIVTVTFQLSSRGKKAIIKFVLNHYYYNFNFLTTVCAVY